MDYSEIQSEVDDLIGLDLTSTERDRLIGEAYSAAVTDSEWLTTTQAAGPTVAGTAAYDLPSGTYRVLKVGVNGVPYYRTTEEQALRFEAGESYYRLPSGAGFYYLSNTGGADQISLYPVPTTAGLSIAATVVKEPTALSAADDEPIFPARFHRMIPEYVKWVVYRGSEDDPEMGSDAKAEYDRYVAELRALRKSRTGRGPLPVRIVGQHV